MLLLLPTTFEELMEIAERYVKYVMKYVYDNHQEDLKQLIQVSKFSPEFTEKDFMTRYNYSLSNNDWTKIKYIDAII